MSVHRLEHVKGTDRFVFIWDDRSTIELACAFGKFAADPELNFEWSDAAQLCRAAEQVMAGQKSADSEPATDS